MFSVKAQRKPGAKGWLRRREGLLAAVGGCAFAIFWTLVAFDIDLVPWSVSLPFHAFAMVTLAAGALGLQRSQVEARPDAWWGWVPAGALALSVFVSFEIFLAAVIAFGVGALVLGHLSRAGAAAAVLGALIFLAAFFAHGPFWSENDPKPSLFLAVLFTIGLVVMATGWALMGAADASNRSAAFEVGEVPATG
jgi:hypothetical protein